MTQPAPAVDDLDPDRFRTVLGGVPTSVAAVTATFEGQPIGTTIGSFVSISLDPPLVGFSVARTSTTWPRLRQATTFCCNLLAADQAAIGRQFARSGADKFAGVQWRPGPAGAPVLDGSLAWIECVLDAVHAAGDHDIVVGRVTALDLMRPDAPPLVFFRRALGTFAVPTEGDGHGG